MPEPSAQDRLDLLSEGQRAVLALVAEYKSSKEIARELGISPNTVDQRLKRVQAILGVSGRFDAARLLRSARDGQAGELCGDLVYRSPGMAEPTGAGNDAASPGMESRPGNRDTLFQPQAAYVADLSDSGGRPFRLSALLEIGRPNELSPLARAMCIGVMTLVAMLALAASVAIAEGMSRLF